MEASCPDCSAPIVEGRTRCSLCARLAWGRQQRYIAAVALVRRLGALLGGVSALVDSRIAFEEWCELKKEVTKLENIHEGLVDDMMLQNLIDKSNNIVRRRTA